MEHLPPETQIHQKNTAAPKSPPRANPSSKTGDFTPNIMSESYAESPGCQVIPTGFLFFHGLVHFVRSASIQTNAFDSGHPAPAMQKRSMKDFCKESFMKITMYYFFTLQAGDFPEKPQKNTNQCVGTKFALCFCHFLLMAPSRKGTEIEVIS